MAENLVRDLILRTAKNKPKKIAYICGERSITWQEIHQRSDLVIAAMQKLGLGCASSVGVLAPETIEVYEHFFACFKAGFIRVGINRRFSCGEILHIVKDGDLEMLFLHADCVAQIESIIDELRSLGVVLVGFGGDHGLALDYETLLLSAGKAEYPDIDSNAAAMYTYTSGTTGSPKGVILSDRAIRTVIQNSPGCFGFSPDEIFYCPLANSWAAVVTNLLGLANGMTLVIPDKEYETKAFLLDVERQRITAFLLAPTMLLWALDEMKTRAYDVSSVRLVMYGSAPASPKLVRDVSNGFNCGMLQAYGTSETAAGWISSLSPQDHKRALGECEELLQSAGRVPSYFDISIRDEDGVEVLQGEIGEIWVRSDTIMSGYLNLPDQTEEVMKEGWLITNDMGMMDEEGYLFLKDRRKFMIVTGGINVFPTGIEAVMGQHPAVKEMAVFGVPHPVWGEAVVAVVQRTPDFNSVSPSELIEFCAGRLAKVMLPKYIHFVDEPLPKSTSLKVQKHLLQQMFRDNPEWLPW